MDCIAKIAPVVARYAGHPDMLQKVEAAVRVTQNNDKAVEHGVMGAKILEAVIMGKTISQAIEETTSEIAKDSEGELDQAMADLFKLLEESASMSHVDAVGKFGRS